METGTLKDLNVQPGDVVVDARGFKAAIVHKRGAVCIQYPHWDDAVFIPTEKETHTGFAIVSRAKPTGPVRTVTRKEIVPGVYGDVEVSSDDTYQGGVGLYVNATVDAKRIRAAIATLTEIADALDGAE